MVSSVCDGLLYFAPYSCPTPRINIILTARYKCPRRKWQPLEVLYYCWPIFISITTLTTVSLLLRDPTRLATNEAEYGSGCLFYFESVCFPRPGKQQDLVAQFAGPNLQGPQSIQSAETTHRCNAQNSVSEPDSCFGNACTLHGTTLHGKITVRI